MSVEKQRKNRRGFNLAPYMWKKGQSGNIMGRPKGKTMKEYARQYLERMTDEERDTWLEGLPKEIIWKMSEGNPTDEVKGDLNVNVNLSGSIAKKHGINGSTGQNSV